MRKSRFLPVFVAVLFLTAGGGLDAAAWEGGATPEVSGRPLRKGWVIGYDPTVTAVILHTRDGGQTWVEQGDRSLWAGYNGLDISAVDGQTAWAALGSDAEGMILHTRNGGKKWKAQRLPEGIGPVKQIKGLSRTVAWAVTMDGTILRTKNGGAKWKVVEHPGVPITQVNRMDALGPKTSDVRIVDEQGGRWGMVHTQDNGRTWRREWVDYADDDGSRPGLHMTCSHSRQVAWCTTWWSGELFRTTDGGDTWESLGMMSGPNDVDDMCSPTPDTLWAVQNLSGNSSGLIFHVRVQNGQVAVEQFNPNTLYIKEGVTCAEDLHVVVVGSRAAEADPTFPMGIILRTDDGGLNWTEQPTPVDDVVFWKVSFVGAQR